MNFLEEDIELFNEKLDNQNSILINENSILMNENNLNLCDCDKDILHYYDIDIITNIVNDNFSVHKFNINDIKIYVDIGQIIFDNMFNLLLIYINTKNINVLFPRYQISNYINNYNISNIIDITMNYFYTDMNNLISLGYDMNKINSLYLFYEVKTKENRNNLYNNERVSLLGYFIYNSMNYFFDIHNTDNNYILYDVISKIFIYLLNNGLNPNIINYFPDNNVMSISAYILILMNKYNNNRLNLLRDKNVLEITLESLRISNSKNENIVNHIKQDIVRNAIYKDIKNTIKDDKTRKIIDNCLLNVVKKILDIDVNLERINRSLSLLTWMFNSVMNYPDTLESKIITIYNDVSIKNVKELIYSEYIVKECRDFIINKYNI